MSLDALEARGKALGATAAAGAAARLAETVTAELPGVQAEVMPGGVAISGRGLVRRMLADPAMRWFGERLR